MNIYSPGADPSFDRKKLGDNDSAELGPSKLWSIILAGGEGSRISPFIKRWLGRHRPKQYCTFVGTRSLLRHTLDRAARLTPGERTLVVVDRTHLPYAQPQLPAEFGARLIAQPCNRDTAAGVFLPLTYIRRNDPGATVAIYPSDHFVYPESRFVATVREAVGEIQLLAGRLILLGVAPDELEVEYGWIHPGPSLDGGRIRTVESFVEKPDVSEARAAMERGALWNTFVLIGKVELLWQLGWRFFPRLMTLFESLQDDIGSEREAARVSSIYTGMPSLNFSSDLLQHAPEHVAVMKLENVLWSDWGRPERIISSLKRIDRTPAFSMKPLRQLHTSA